MIDNLIANIMISMANNGNQKCWYEGNLKSNPFNMLLGSVLKTFNQKNQNIKWKIKKCSYHKIFILFWKKIGL